MLSIGNLRLPSPLMLAPMAGITDLPFRLLNRSFGCGFAFTEMISANSMIHGSRHTLKMLSSTPDDRPLGVQVLSADPEALKKTIDLLAPYRFDLVDLNAACPVSKVVSRAEGAALMKDLPRLSRILRLLAERAAVPVTVKIRAGWDADSVNAIEAAQVAQDAGVQAVFLHGRTKEQGYSGTVDYRLIESAKKSLEIPLIASGDALSSDLIRKLFSETGCDGVAVARGALGYPWIFRESLDFYDNGEIVHEPALGEIVDIMTRHLDANIAFYGESTGVVLFRKFFAWYTRGLTAKELKVKAFRAGTRAEMLGLIASVRAHPPGRRPRAAG